MGYAGYAPAKLPPSKPSEAEAAVLAVKSMETLETIHKLVYNASVQPNESKFRRIRLTNDKIQKVLVDCPGALDAMAALGWAVEEAEPEFLVIPAGKFMTMTQVRIIEAARDKLGKELKDATRHANAAL